MGVFLGDCADRGGDPCVKHFCQSHVFRWRTATNEYYMANWQQLRQTRKGRTACAEHHAFCFNAGDIGISFINAIMTLIAFLPVLVTLSTACAELPIIGHIP
ncbi:SbmA/BacA-like family transporter [Shigella flexneri]